MKFTVSPNLIMTKGFTLIETIIYISLFSLLITSVLGTSLSLTKSESADDSQTNDNILLNSVYNYEI
jgi:type II secretory pathway pseudopilin PulG